MIGDDLIDGDPSAADVVADGLFDRHTGQQAGRLGVVSVGALEYGILIHQLAEDEDILPVALEWQKLARHLEVGARAAGSPVLRMHSVRHEEKRRTDRGLYRSGTGLYAGNRHRFQERQRNTSSHSL